MPAKRIASRDSPQRHRPAADDSILSNRIARVRGATRFKATSRPIHRMNHRRNSSTINGDKTKSDQSRSAQNRYAQANAEHGMCALHIHSSSRRVAPHPIFFSHTRKRETQGGFRIRIFSPCICAPHHAPLALIRALRLRAPVTSSSDINAVARLPAPVRAITTSEVPLASESRIRPRKISRTRRFTRFRITALPIRRDTVTPRRERSGSVSSIPAYSTKCGLWNRKPDRWRRINSALRCNRSTAPKLNGARTIVSPAAWAESRSRDARDPWRGGA